MQMDLLKSKKFIASILASILAFGGLAYGMSPAEIALIVAPLTGYTISQGLADFGKERTK
ncbi:MAG: hypothetical protein GY743_23375 [Planctomycetaceae bacterium]|nr:hypothetical protein [Planctomycetaceae bacterium]